ncbi:unnamed protein product [Schistosoma curassoni]|uniref:Dilute domain-containing protein n=1 Tax=Schistosoma curassoni TaxID=6186 RepID=A0A183K8B7_9TREM|nr:unnamed protein product [Schistosoma curassoni]
MKQHGLLASEGGTVDRCIRFWNRLTGQALRSVDTGRLNDLSKKSLSKLVDISPMCFILLSKYMYNTQCALELDDVTGYFCHLRLIGRPSHGLGSDIIQLKNGSTVDENWTSWNNLSTNIREAVRVPPGLVISLQDCENLRSNRSRMKIRNRN